MHILFVNFEVHSLDASAMAAICNDVAPEFAVIPGLVSKVWLADPATSAYGGVYTFENRTASQAYLDSELFASLSKSPYFANISVKDFEVLESPSRVTRGFVSPRVQAA